MIVARTIETKNYVCKVDRENPAEEQTRFLLKTLSAQDMASFQDRLLAKGENSYSMSAMQGLLLQALVGWENFQNADGKPVKFNLKDKQSNLDLLPSEVLMELVEAVMKANFPDADGELEKNS